MIALTLPVPPSANHYKGFSRSTGWYRTKQADNYRAMVARLCRVAKVKPIDKGAVCVTLVIFRGLDRNGKMQRGDLDNYQKVLFDALQGFVFRNDSQVRRMLCELRDDRQNPRVELVALPYLAEEVQPTLQAQVVETGLNTRVFRALRLAEAYVPPAGKRGVHGEPKQQEGQQGRPDGG